MNRERNVDVFFGMILAFALWVIMFVMRPFNFWLMMSFSTSLLAAWSFALCRPMITRDELSLRNVVFGLLAAVLLYALFWVGNQALMILSGALPSLIPDRAGNIRAVYANRGGLSPLLVAMLLFFPIGFGEEVFWRGFVQRRLTASWGPWAAFLCTSLFYTAAHLPTLNPVLILAALTCGLFWGALYMVSGRLVPVLVSHMLWDPAIFVVWPMK